MRRLVAAAFPLALLVALVVGVLVVVEDSRADLDNQVFTSNADRLRIVVPRGWRATDQPSYPGLLLWMMRTQPPGQIVLTSEAFTRELYCRWPIACRQSAESLTEKYACSLRTKLGAQRLRVGPVQQGPKENEASGLPSVWFEFDDRKRYARQAVAVTADRAVSLVLSAPTSDARAAHVRAFDQALRTLRLLTAAETAPIDAGVATGDGGPGDASIGGAVIDPAAAARVNPVGPCPQ